MKKEVEEENSDQDSENAVETKQRATITAVTTENFLEWKRKFDEEMAELKKKEKMMNSEINLRLSGKQFFEKNKNIKMEEPEEEDDENDDDDENDEDYEENSQEND